MPWVGTSSSGHFACATVAHRTLRDLRTKRRGQPVFVVGHLLNRKGQEAVFETFNDRIALVKFRDGGSAGYDPQELLLPTVVEADGTAYFEIRSCAMCELLFPLTIEETNTKDEPTHCHQCRT